MKNELREKLKSRGKEGSQLGMSSKEDNHVHSESPRYLNS